ncbi:MAG TPA: hypothetical protein VI793_00270 [Anaerolineales bacterium]|nr:hypothetical protein [Anaerolineales bacterium]
MRGDEQQLIVHLPCQIFAVQVDKRDLPDYIGSETDLYRLAFWRLLDELDAELARLNQPGMLMLDMRSDMHSSVQDRRVIDAYREWIGSRMGLQLADFVAYLVDWSSNEQTPSRRSGELQEAVAKLRHKMRLVRTP